MTCCFRGTFDDNHVRKVNLSNGSRVWQRKCIDKILSLAVSKDSVVVGVAHSELLVLYLAV